MLKRKQGLSLLQWEIVKVSLKQFHIRFLRHKIHLRILFQKTKSASKAALSLSD